MITVQQEDITKFWLRVYFGSNIENEIILSAIDRSYRDFNRTMHGLAKKNMNKIFKKADSLI